MNDSWLTPDERSLVATALASGDDAVAWWARFTAAHRFDDIWDGERYSLLPACHLALRHTTDLAEGPRLAGIHRRTWVRNQTALTSAAAASAALHGARVDHCLHGDLALALCVHDDVAARVSDFAELLVGVDDVGPALSALGELGWATGRALDGPRMSVTDGTFLAAGDDRLRLSWETCRGVAVSTADRAHVGTVVDRHVAVHTPHGPLPVTGRLDLTVHALCAPAGSIPLRRLRSVVDVATILRAAPDLDEIAGQVGELGVATVARRVADAAVCAGALGAQRLAAALAGIATGAADRRRHELLLRSAAPGRTVHPLRAAHARAAVGLGTMASVAAIPPVVMSEWDLDRPARLATEVPRRLAGRIGRTLRARTVDR